MSSKKHQNNRFLNYHLKIEIENRIFDLIERDVWDHKIESEIKSILNELKN